MGTREIENALTDRWLTVSEIAEKVGGSPQDIRPTLKIIVEAGLAEQGKIRRTRFESGRRTRIVYRQIKSTLS